MQEPAKCLRVSYTASPKQELPPWWLTYLLEQTVRVGVQATDKGLLGIRKAHTCFADNPRTTILVQIFAPSHTLPVLSVPLCKFAAT